VNPESQQALEENAIVAITGNRTSTLAKASEVAITYGNLNEACHNGLAPTTSTTLSLAIGDALAVSVSEMMGTLPTDFHNFHPGGKLGFRLKKVREVMRIGDDLPIVEHSATAGEVVVTISEKAVGAVVLVRDGLVEGIITDGDLRRNVSNLWKLKPIEIAKADPIWIDEDLLVSDAADLMSKRGISVCLIEGSQGELKGIIHLHDCIRT
jgi:arabinose-5-phosphate isomerase